jgi:hypothetical protein
MIGTSDRGRGGSSKYGSTVSLSDVKGDEYVRLSSGPWDFALWGNDDPNSKNGRPSKFGPVVGSSILLGGGPGDGKSTLALQWAGAIAEVLSDPEDYVFYIPSEEGPGMIKGRAARLGIKALNKIRISPEMMTASSLPSAIINDLAKKPRFIVIDSTKVWEAVLETELIELKRVIDKIGAIALSVHQVNKDYDFVGEQAVKHAVDVLMAIVSRDDGTDIREIFTVKNRFGRTNWPSLFEMTATGLKFLGIKEDIEQPDKKGKGKGNGRKDKSPAAKTLPLVRDNEDIDEDLEDDEGPIVLPYGTIPLETEYFAVNPKEVPIEIEAEDGESEVDAAELWQVISETFAEWKQKPSDETKDSIVSALELGGFTWDKNQ